MNWYKTSQQIEMIEQTNRNNPNYVGYEDIGHDWHNEINRVDDVQDDYEGGTSNYIWVFIDGKVDIEEETEDIYAHVLVRRWDELDFDRFYSGRYSKNSGIASITKPSFGASQFRDVPRSIQYALKQAFPGIKQMYVY